MRAELGCEPKVLPWADVLRDPDRALATLEEAATIRIDSPGKNWEVEKALLQWGAEQADELDPLAQRWRRLSKAQCASLTDDPGRIQPSRQWWLGFRAALRAIHRAPASARWMQSPAAIVEMFDKAACSLKLQSAHCPVPKCLGVPSGFDELISLMDAVGISRVFLKLCHGSSASGALALEKSRDRIQGFSTSKMVDQSDGLELYNQRQVQRYESLSDLRRLVNRLCQERALVEAWIPKAGWDNLRFDVRVLVIHGKARHTVARLSNSPFTNLQLGGQRRSAKELCHHVGNATYHLLLQTAEQAAARFPEAHYSGVDVTLESGRRRAYVLEVNAFGDLLPGLLEDGRDTYSWEIREWKA